jgi:indole-3-acetate monooxygenase
LEVARAFRPCIIIAERDDINDIEASRRLPEGSRENFRGVGVWADASVAWCVSNGNTHWTTAQLASEAARTIHADPDVVTANSTRASGQAQIVAGGHRASGRWSLVSGCELAAWMVLLCVVHQDGKPRLTPAGAPETRFVRVPATECEIIDT